MKQKIALFLATGLGLGYLPKMPGTFGSLLGLPLWYVCSHLSLVWQGVILIFAIAASVYIASLAEEFLQTHDSQRIVIDEVVGIMCTGFGIGFSWQFAIAVFVLFRVLDILKPWPIRVFDKNMAGGLGVVLDDVVAGFIACGLLHLTLFFMR